ncbi:MAG: PAS domain-containing protein [Saccharofermentanales bacterium]
MKLSKTDLKILESYKTILDGLGNYMGAGYELVLHSLERLDKSVIKIVNGHYSNRTEGAPVTDLALKMLQEIQNSDSSHQFKTYFSVNKNGRTTKSSTLPIIGEDNRIIGLLCINFYLDTPLSSVLDGFVSIASTSGSENENFAANAQEVFSSVLDNARQKVLNSPSIPSTMRNREIIAILFDEGIFKLKNAVQKVADNLGISKNTVYMHIRQLEKEAQEKN